MDNRITKYDFKETHSQRDTCVGNDALIPTHSAYICDQNQYIHTEMLLMSGRNKKYNIGINMSSKGYGQ